MKNGDTVHHGICGGEVGNRRQRLRISSPTLYIFLFRKTDSDILFLSLN